MKRGKPMFVTQQTGNDVVWDEDIYVVQQKKVAAGPACVQ
jgi:hypothetical protein